MLTNAAGFPLGYEIFEGNKFKGHTLLSVVEVFKKGYTIKQLVGVADCGLMSKENINKQIDKKYEFIMGARIKNEKLVSTGKLTKKQISNKGYNK